VPSGWTVDPQVVPYVLGTALLAGLCVLFALPSHPRLPPTVDRQGHGSSLTWPLATSARSVLLWRTRLVLGMLAGATVALLGVGRLGWPAWILAAGVGAGVAHFSARLEPVGHHRRKRELVRQTPQALDLLAATLSSGLPLRSATAAVVRACPGPVGEALSGILRQIDLGVGDAEAWRMLIRHPQLGPAAADLARSVESGSRMTEALTSHADEARASRSAAVEIAARQVGVRSVFPLMLCFIPSFLLLGIVPTVVSAVLAALAQ
jgi:hypothetical protein